MPNHFLDVRSKKSRLETPVRYDSSENERACQGIVFADTNVLQKVIAGPYKVTNTTADLTARRGVRIFIHLINIAARNTAADAGTNAGITFYVGGTARSALVYLVPSAANCANVSFPMDVLCDENSTISGSGVNVGDWGYTIAYQEVVIAEE